MTTPSTPTRPSISWERGDFIENIEGTKVYNAYGISLDGRTWIGNWNDYTFDIEIDGIEEE